MARLTARRSFPAPQSAIHWQAVQTAAFEHRAIEVIQLSEAGDVAGRGTVRPASTVWRWASLLAALALLLLFSSTEAARWKDAVVVVRDYTGGRRWGPIIADQVDALNAALPSGAPRFVYEDAGPLSCRELPAQQGAISICAQEHLSRPATTSTLRRKQTIVGATITLRQDQVRVLGQNRVCHELMHAATAIADDYHTEPESCVRGGLSTFGAWDLSLLADEYGREGR